MGVAGNRAAIDAVSMGHRQISCNASGTESAAGSQTIELRDARNRQNQREAIQKGNRTSPGERHADILFELIDAAGAAGNLTTDAHLAALAIEHQAELHSTDADMARFPGLRWINPLV